MTDPTTPTSDAPKPQPAAPAEVESLRSRTLNAIVGLCVLAALFVAVNVLAGPWLRQTRLDLTSDQRYTLSEGTREILRDIGTRGPSRLTFFYSREAATGRPAIQAYAARVDELLEEFELAAGGSFRIERVEPKAFSAQEARAQASGVASLPLGTDGQALFMGIEAAGPTDLRGTIPFLDPQQEPFLEYELAKLLVSVRSPLRPVVGVVSSLDLQRGPSNRPWLIWQELSTRFELRDMGQDFAGIDTAVRALLIVHPQGLSERALRTIDQAALAGTPMVVLFDPVCELDQPEGNQSNPMLAFQSDRSSDLGGLLEAWGATIDTDVVAGDIDSAARVRSQGQVVPYLPYLQLSSERFNQDDPATRQIDAMIFASAGAIVSMPGARTSFEPLITTSERSALIDAVRINPMTDPRELVDSFVSRGAPLTLAARVRGQASSAFAEPALDATGIADPEWQPPKLTGGEVDVLLIADADLLADQFWLEEVGYGGASLGYRRISDNGDLVLNAIEMAAGDRALLSLRGRGNASRPFTRIADLQRRADEQFSAELKSLEADRDEVEAQIRLAQQGDPEAPLEDQLILTPEQAQRVEAFRGQLVETNRRLREVRFNLNEDVDRLEAWVKAVNVGAGPLLVIIVAVLLSVIRSVRFAADRRRAASAPGST